MYSRNIKIFAFALILFSVLSIASASEFSLTASQIPINNVEYSSDTDSADIFICPNTWTQYDIELFKGASKIGTTLHWADTSGECAEVKDIKKYFGELDEYSNYMVVLRGINWATGKVSNIYEQAFYTSKSGYECHDNTVSCLYGICTVTKANCDSTMKYFAISVYDIAKGTTSYPFSTFKSWLSFGNKYTLALEYNKNYLVSIATLDELSYSYVDTQTEYISSGSCRNPVFVLGSAETSNSTKISIFGDIGEYKTFTWNIYKFEGGSYKFAQSGVSNSKDFTITGLQSSTKYKVNVLGNNPCESGASSYVEFTTTGATTPITLNYTESMGDYNITISPNASSLYEFSVFETTTGAKLLTNTTTNNYFMVENVSLGASLTIVVKSFQTYGTTEASLVIYRDASSFQISTEAYSYSQTEIHHAMFFEYTNGTKTYFPAQRLNATIHAVNGTDIHTFSDILSGYNGNNIHSTNMYGLTPSTYYTIYSNLTANDGLVYSATTNATTMAQNTSSYSADFSISDASRDAYVLGSRMDIDVYAYIKTGLLTYASGFSYELYENTTGAGKIIPVKSETSVTGNYALLYDIIPERTYIFAVKNPVINGVTYTDRNFTLSYMSLVSVECAGETYIIPFNSTFQLNSGKISIYPSAEDSGLRSFNEVTTKWTSTVLTPEPRADDNGTYVYDVVSDRIFTNNIFTSYEEVGDYDTTYDTAIVQISRTLYCSGTPIAFTERDWIIPTTESTGQYGAIQGVYDFFDEYFPTQFSKFFIIMGISILIGIFAWASLSFNGVSSGWAVGLVPVVLGFIISWIIGAVPLAIVGFLALLIIGLILFKVASVLLSGGG